MAGVDEAKEELQEIIEFLKEPQKFQKLGGRIPKGVLLMGPPGTGKTLLARAIAGEADVPFFSISGSDFVEMFVGVGASRVRDLFEQGKKNAPCIIFIDEIDAVGRHRGAGLGGGHDEREQTLNQLLVEMDGFESNEGVILIAATNRPDVLDPALLRPGRFDRRVVVVAARRARPRGHPAGPHAQDPARRRRGPLDARARHAGLLGRRPRQPRERGRARWPRAQARRSSRCSDFECAKDKVLMGAERKSMIITDEEKKITAYHEAGPRARRGSRAALGPAAQGDDHPARPGARASPSSCRARIATTAREDRSRRASRCCMGGRIAEETHLRADHHRRGERHRAGATELARKMVCEWGMSETLGPLTYGKKEEQIFLGQEIAQHQDYSEDTALKIDHEVKRIVSEQYERAAKLLTEQRPVLVRIAEALLEREVLDAPQLKQLIAGEPLTVKVPTPPVAAPTREPSAPEESRPAGILPPPVPDPRPTS